MAFLHMHHAMANRALMIEQCSSNDFWTVDKTKLREIVMSGAVDPKSNALFESGSVTPEDRDIVLRYLNA